MVVNELRGEKIDIVSWSEDPAQFVAEALSPAKVKSVQIDEPERTAHVVVPDYQLSLAIGKEGRMPGWRRADRLADRHREREPGRRAGEPGPRR